MEYQYDCDTCVVFMGNLKNEKNKKLVNSLYNLYTKCLNIYLRKNDIQIVKSGELIGAYIYLQSESDAEKACYFLGSWERRKQLQFHFFRLVDPSVQLTINRIQSGVTNSVANRQTWTDRVESRSQQPKSDRYTDNIVLGNHSNTRSYEDGELLGNETRNKEFKEGGGEHYIKKNLKEHVAKYMCGFLNSSQQGTLFIGVKDSGSVVGIECDQQKEDKIRLKIDHIIKTIKPVIFPKDYHVEFVPVYRHGQPKGDFKVVEISVDKVHDDNQTQLYEAAGEVYIRRDGSLQGPLKPFEIQEWTKQIHQKGIQQKEKEIQLKEKEIKQKEREIYEKEKEIQRKETELHLKETELKTRKNKSKTCVMM